ncbi:DUF3108 domain-containing protein [Polaromonas jejuensis]|uniref:DUF3108 domain-containing protein n=2 Tax=Polaromonas jejuensis TaxID=457502 RepID=A0ABW0QBV7_9BURK
MSRLAPPAPQTATGPSARPPWGTLLALAGLVLAAHTLVLRISPRPPGAELAPPSPRSAAFVTRRIELPPAAEAPVPPVAKPVKKPVLKKKMAPAQAEPAQEATEMIANSSPEPAAAGGLTPPVQGEGTATPDTPGAGSAAPAPSPASAASAPTAPPAGPNPTPVTAMALPESAQLAYRMTGSAKGLTYHANGELDWRNNGHSYEARMTVSALLLGSRSLASTGQISAEGLAPTRFSDKSRSEVAAHFEPDKGQISFSANTPSVPWVKGTQDRASVFIQLGGMLAGQPAAFPVGTTLVMYTVGPRDADSWTFRVEAEETLSLPFGELATVKLVRQPRREFDQTVEIWFAPSLGYLPVRSKITQHNGDFVDQQLSDVHKR